MESKLKASRRNRRKELYKGKPLYGPRSRSGRKPAQSRTLWPARLRSRSNRRAAARKIRLRRETRPQAGAEYDPYEDIGRLEIPVDDWWGCAVKEGASLGDVFGQLEPKRPCVRHGRVLVLSFLKDEIVKRTVLDVFGDDGARVQRESLERHNVRMLQTADSIRESAERIIKCMNDAPHDPYFVAELFERFAEVLLALVLTATSECSVS